MDRTISYRSLVNILVIFVMWFNALAPALSHAVQGNGNGEDSYVVICTSTGTKLVKLDSKSVERNQTQGFHNDSNCLLCAQHTSLTGIPPSEFHPDFNSITADFYPSSKSDQTVISTKWTHYTTRAPPSVI